MVQNIAFIREDKPGPKWQSLFKSFWPNYKEWFLREGYRARPGYMTSLKKLGQHMPELMPIYRQLTELAGGEDLAARFLSLYCPPPYVSGCSQAVWTRNDPFLIRNYDYSPKLFEGTVFYTNWRRPVLAVIDSLWGVLDGINDAGLAVSLAFGGRKVVGEGFGVPLILRYVLEMCDDIRAATATLRRVPVHMPYNVTILDRKARFITAFLSPDRAAVITEEAIATNHQEEIEWEDYVRITSSVERKNYLESNLTGSKETAQKFIGRFRKPPLHNTQYEKAFGTLYTAAYQPRKLAVDYYWPNRNVMQSLSHFQEKKIAVDLGSADPTLQTPD